MGARAAPVPLLRRTGPGAEALVVLAAAHLELRAALAVAVCPEPDRVAAAALSGRLSALLAIHRADEEDDLFPALLAVASSDERLEATLERLRGEHAGLAAAAQGAAAALARIGSGQDGPTDRLALHAFCALKRRHMAFETAVILPLARARLDASRRFEIARRMAARRGLRLPPGAEEPTHA